MACPASGTISIQDIVDEFGGSGPHSLSEYYRDGANVPGNNTSVPTSGAIALANFYSAVNEIQYTCSSDVQNLNLETAFTTSNWTSTVPKRLIVNSGVTVGTTGSNYAINIPDSMAGTLTIDNNGNIYGSPGAAGSAGSNGGVGGTAIFIHTGNTSSDITINNASGANIKGGGGGGGGGGTGGAGGTGGTGGTGGNGTYYYGTSTVSGPGVNPNNNNMSYHCGVCRDQLNGYWRGSSHSACGMTMSPGYTQNVCRNFVGSGEYYNGHYWPPTGSSACQQGCPDLGGISATCNTTNMSNHITTAGSFLCAILPSNPGYEILCIGTTSSTQSGGSGGNGGSGGAGGAGGAGGTGQDWDSAAGSGSNGSGGANGSGGSSGSNPGNNAGQGGTGGTGGAGATGGAGGAGGALGASGSNGTDGPQGNQGASGNTGANGNASNGSGGSSGSGGSGGGSAGSGAAAGYYIQNKGSATLNNSGTVGGQV